MQIHPYRYATLEDLPELRTLMDLSIRKYIGAILDAAQLEASFELMGVDTSLIEDGTYFAVTLDQKIVGCGGWSRRATLFGGDHTGGRDARLLDPATEPARVRAMYTHPDHGRKGIGSFILSLCEAAAKKEGYTTLELMATVSGEPMYLVHGFKEIERVEIFTATGVAVPLIRMRKRVTG